MIVLYTDGVSVCGFEFYFAYVWVVILGFFVAIWSCFSTLCSFVMIMYFYYKAFSFFVYFCWGEYFYKCVCINIFQLALVDVIDHFFHCFYISPWDYWSHNIGRSAVGGRNIAKHVTSNKIFCKTKAPEISAKTGGLPLLNYFIYIWRK